MTAGVATRRAAAILLAAVLGACGAGSSGATETRPAPPSGLLVTFERSGGLAGFRDRVRVRRSGHMAVTRRQLAPRTRHTRLGPHRLGRLRRAIRDARLPRHARYPGPPGSADDFHYLIVTPGHRVVADGLGRAPPRITRLIARLTALLG